MYLLTNQPYFGSLHKLRYHKTEIPFFPTLAMSVFIPLYSDHNYTLLFTSHFLPPFCYISERQHFPPPPCNNSSPSLLLDLTPPLRNCHLLYPLFYCRAALTEPHLPLFPRLITPNSPNLALVPQKLKSMLSNVGTVEKAELVDDGDDNQWKRGIVTYELKEEAQAAMEKFHESNFEVS